MLHQTAIAAVRTVTFALIAASLSACALSRNPIAPLSAAIAAPELVGTWKSVPVGEENCTGTVYLHIYPLNTPDKKQIEVLAVGHDAGPLGQTSWYAADGYVTRLPNGLFLNLQAVADGPEKNISERDRRALSEASKAGYFVFAAYDFSAVGSKRRLRLGIGVLNALYATLKPGDRDRSVVEDSSDRIADFVGSLSEDDLFRPSCLFDQVD